MIWIGFNIALDVLDVFKLQVALQSRTGGATGLGVEDHLVLSFRLVEVVSQVIEPCLLICPYRHVYTYLSVAGSDRLGSRRFQTFS